MSLIEFSLQFFSLRNLMWTFSLCISMILWFRGIQLVTNLLTCCTNNSNTFLIKMIVPYWPFNSYDCHKYGICYILSHKTLSKNDFIYTPPPIHPPIISYVDETHSYWTLRGVWVLGCIAGTSISRDIVHQQGLTCGLFHPVSNLESSWSLSFDFMFGVMCD